MTRVEKSAEQVRDMVMLDEDAAREAQTVVDLYKNKGRITKDVQMTLTDADGLTPLQEKFCREILNDWNPKEAAIRAGYAKTTATYAIGKVLSHKKIRRRIHEIAAGLECGAINDKEWLVRKLTQGINAAIPPSIGYGTGEKVNLQGVASLATLLVKLKGWAEPDRVDHTHSGKEGGPAIEVKKAMGKMEDLTDDELKQFHELVTKIGTPSI